MSFIKIEKNNCPACDRMSIFLAANEVEYTTLNMDNPEQVNEARTYLQKLGLFTVPVLMKVNDSGVVQDYSAGADAQNMAKLINA